MKVPLPEDPEFKEILEFLLLAKGFDGRHYKVNYVKRRVAIRMRATDSGTYGNYLRVLKADPREPATLLDRLTIHVTGFFRDPDVFQAVESKILRGLRSGPIKVWCAGCSTGEEAYSAAILLKEWAGTRHGASFEVLATDIDRASVRAAENGAYPVEAFKAMSRARMERWFRLEGVRAKAVTELKGRVRFRVHDLLGEWPRELAGFQVIFCRNLLIYLTAHQQQRLYERFRTALAGDGFLVLGQTETMMGASRRHFRCVDVKQRIYQVLDPGAEDPRESKGIGVRVG